MMIKRKSYSSYGSRLTVLLWIASVSLHLHDFRVVRNKWRLAARASEHQSIILFIGIGICQVYCAMLDRFMSESCSRALTSS